MGPGDRGWRVERLLVTGAAGFIGSWLVAHLRRRDPGIEIVAVDALAYAGWSAEAVADAGVRVLVGDIRDEAFVRSAMRGCDAVINVAAETHVDRSLVDPWPFLRANVEGVLVLLQAAHKVGVRRFVQVSTDEVYGDATAREMVPSREGDALAPRSPYAATKAAAEHLVASFGASFGMEVVITRGCNTYGPRQYPEKIVPLFITNALLDLPLPVYGSGTAVRDYLHVMDHCAGIACALLRGQAGAAYNLGAGRAVSALDVAETVLALTGKPRDRIVHVADRPGHDYAYAVDSARAAALGWRPKVDWLSGLAETVAWYRAHPGWWLAIRRQEAFQRLIEARFGPDTARLWYGALGRAAGARADGLDGGAPA